MFSLVLLLHVLVAAACIHEHCEEPENPLCDRCSTSPLVPVEEAGGRNSNKSQSCAYTDWSEFVTPELWSHWHPPKEDDKILFRDGNVTVTAHDHECFRAMRVGAMVGSVARCPGGICQEQALLGEYAKTMASLTAAFSPWMHNWAHGNPPISTLDILMLGLGGGALLSFLASKASPLLEHIGKITAVEIDQRIVTGAAEYMGLSPSVDVIIGDAFDLKTWHKGERYDVIFVDTCTCTSAEALAVTELRARVSKSNGIIILNYLDYLPLKNADWESFAIDVTQAFRSAFSDGVVVKLPLKKWINTIVVGLPEEPPSEFLSLSSRVAQEARWPFDTVERIYFLDWE